MSTIYNSQNAYYKTPFGAVCVGDSVAFTLRVPAEYHCATPYLIINRDGEAPQLLPLSYVESDGETTVFSITFTPDTTCLYFYYFDLYTGYRKLYCGELGEAYLSTETGTPWQLTVYDKNFTTPKALAGGVIYQIFPDRFYEGVKNKPLIFADRIYRDDKENEPYFWPNEQHEGYLNLDYYGGDFAGIREKLPYLSSLGVTCIYLNPIFEAHSNHRYNTADYRKADPLLGTNEEFAALCREAKKCGIGIVLDGVFSHTGSDSVYFNRECRYPTCGAYQSTHSPYRKWYDFSRNYACGYRSWWGFETLPEVNENEPSFRKFICGEGGVIDYWLSLGASGFRLDVADELPDDFIEDIRTAVKRNGEDKYLLGEVWEDATNKFSYGRRRTYLLGKGLDAVMNYPFRNAVLAFVTGENARRTANSLMHICENYPAPALHVLMNFMSTHDTVRAITAIAGEPIDGHNRYWQSGRRLSAEQYERGRKLLTLAYVLTFTLPGIPSIYYGDEICMQGYKDPFNRGYFDWDSRETRMRPVLQQLAALRHTHSAFKDGALVIVKAIDGVLLYERRNAEETVAVCVNRSGDTLHEVLCGREITVNPYHFAIETQKNET
ncbi:MAG: glycoside hydrolase family 13 protein [Ruthenibacterium sp.]